LRYLDASAIVKLVALEPESDELVKVIRADPQVLSSAIARTEVVRSVRRAGGSIARAERVLATIALIPVDEAILREAASLRPPTLRTLDAIHVASALSVGDDIDGLVTYDARQAEAASLAGLDVLSPGRS
jgi:hypothetical protein